MKRILSAQEMRGAMLRVTVTAVAITGSLGSVAVTAQTVAPGPAGAANLPAISPGVPSSEDDRIAVSGTGSSLTDTSGGGGASLGWLHNFDADTLLGAAGEYDALSVSHWSFGSLSGSMTRGPGDQRYTLYGEAHEGAGDDGNKAFKYRVEALGVSGTYIHRLSVTAEDKQIDVETTHGNLPKAAVSYLWNPHLQTAVAYQYSVSGNLGTHLLSARVDVYGSQVNFIAGGATGQASPSVLGFGFVLPPHDLREGYVGLSKPLPQLRSEVTLIMDYQRLSGGTGLLSTGTQTIFVVPASTRWTGTLNYIFHIGHYGTK